MLAVVLIWLFMVFVPGIITPVYGQDHRVSTTEMAVLDKNERYFIHEDSYKGIKLRIYLLQEDEGLARRYLDYTKRYLKLYESLLGSFPYDSFSIVESPEQEGVSLPGYAVFGSRVLRLPFIVETSLGHEIVHQWFGAYVDVDYERGNWSEGLTTYLSDYLYEEQKGRGREYRKKILTDYENYVTPDKEISLREFRSRSDFATRTIGYGKSAMLFHMLRRMGGDELFYKSLRRFIKENAGRQASWDDLRKAFEAVYGRKLDGFFKQWLERKGLPRIEVDTAHVTYRKGAYRLTLTLSERGDIYDLNIPVRIGYADKEETLNVNLKERTRTFEWSFPERPVRVAIDPDYDLLRRLAEPEIPPVVSGFTGKTDSFIIVPEGYNGLIERLGEIFPDRKDNIVQEKAYKFNNTKDHSLLIISKDSPVFRRLFARAPSYDGDTLVRVYKNPLNSRYVVVLVDGTDREGILNVLKRLKHYGNYSRLVFRQGRNILKETDESDNGIVIDLKLTIDTVDVKRQPDFDELINSIKDRRLIYVGEMHTAYSHHLVQFEIIKRLFEKNKRLMIGMEMFQRPFQKYIDQYIEGSISEDEFLKKTEYFKRWSYNYNLYRDILQFARQKRIPVIALNIRKEIVDKVSKKGLDGLTDEEKKLLPDDIDMTNEEYRESLKDIFMQHRNPDKKDFDNFYLSQLLWDETMAHTIVESLKKNPGYQMVVLAGNGHLQSSWGIPSRVKRLMDVDYTLILNSPGEDINRGLADYVLFPSYVPAPRAPRLGILTEETEEGLEVKRVFDGTPASRAGIEEGDIILSIDGREIKGLDDLKILLLHKAKGDRIKVKVSRSVFIFGSEETTMELTL